MLTVAGNGDGIGRVVTAPGAEPGLSCDLAGSATPTGTCARGELTDYGLTHSARAELCRKLGRTKEAVAAYERARGLTSQEPQRRFVEQRLSQLRGTGAESQ